VTGTLHGHEITKPPTAGLAATNEQLDSIMRHHIINELCKTTGPEPPVQTME